MGMLNNPDLKPKQEYQPAGDTFLQEYIAEIERPKQQQMMPEIPDDSEVEDPENFSQEQIPEPSRYQQKRGQTTARFAVSTIDKVIASMVAVYAHSDSIEDFQAEDDELEDLAEQWGFYFTESNLDLPPWVFALITTGFVLMKKFKSAGSVRKANIEMKKFRDENTTLKNQLELLEAKNKMLQLKKQVEELESKTISD